MNKNLHHIDELFRSALEGHEEIPDGGVKERLNAALDKKNNESKKRGFIIWKRSAFLLLLLLTGFILYESGIWKTKARHSNHTTADKKSNEETPKKESQNSIAPGNTIDNINNDNPADYINETGNKKVEHFNGSEIAEIANKTVSKTKSPANKIAVQKNVPANDHPDFFTRNTKIIPVNPDKKIDDALRNNDQLQEEKINSLTHPRINSIGKITGLLVNNPDIPQLFSVNDSLLKNSNAKKVKDKKTGFFNPFWMMSSFISYDKVGYTLDSDEPLAVASLKHREAHEPSFSMGLLLTRQLTRRWGLQSGIIYSNIAIGMKPQKTYAFQDPTGDIAYKYITSSGYAFIKPGFGPQPAVGDSLTTAEGKHRMEHISVPLVIKHTIPGKKISLNPGAGIEATFITKANLEVDIEDPFNREIVIVRKLNGTKSFYLSFVADAEIKYIVNKKVSLSVRPLYKHAISPITKNNVVETFPHSFGLGAGVTIKF